MHKHTINPDTTLIQVSVSVAGVKRTTREISDQKIGDAREITNQSDTRITNVDAYELAKSLEGRARTLARKHGTDALGIQGYLTDAKRLAKFREDMNDLREEIRVHNLTHPEHALKLTVVEIAIAPGITPELSRQVFAEVEGKLFGIGTAIREGRLNDATRDLGLYKNLSALCPAVVATLIDDALLEAREAVKAIRADVRDEEKKAAKAGRPYFADLAKLGQAADLSKLNVAIGWCTMADSADDDTTGATQPTAQA
jgi:hypothetical protein